MNGATVSAVTIAELVTVLTREGHAPEIVVAIIEQLRFIVEPFGLESALTTGLLQAKTSRHGLSLGDRACLALAIDRKLPVLTADRAWRDLDLGIEIRVVR
jgi:ribonuclease VapC